MSSAGPLTDDALPAFFRDLGLPGAVDMHVHFMPERLLRKVWAHFDAAPATYGYAWPIRYRHDEQTRIDTLRRLGVRAHTALVYPHKPGIAAGLNDWCRAFAARVPGCVPSGTFFAEPEAVDYVRAALDNGVRVFKAHVQVGGYDPTDPLLDPVWGMLADAGAPVVCHCGSGPVPGAFTGPGPIGAVLARHPR